MAALNRILFCLTENIPHITLQLNGTLSRRMVCTYLHFSCKASERSCLYPQFNLQLEQDSMKSLRAVGLKTKYFMKLITGKNPLFFLTEKSDDLHDLFEHK